MDICYEHNGLTFIARDAVIGFDAQGHLLSVVHIETDGECIRIISARKATKEEVKYYDS